MDIKRLLGRVEEELEETQCIRHGHGFVFIQSLHATPQELCRAASRILIPPKILLTKAAEVGRPHTCAARGGGEDSSEAVFVGARGSIACLAAPFVQANAEPASECIPQPMPYMQTFVRPKFRTSRGQSLYGPPSLRTVSASAS